MVGMFNQDLFHRGSQKASLPGKLFHGLILMLLSLNLCWAQQIGSSQNDSQIRRPVGNVENWASLSLAGSELIPEEPLLGERDDNPHFTRELWQVKWRQGDPIDLYVIRPKGVAKPPVVLHLYSYPSETDIFRDDDYCADLTRDGLAAVGFVSALTGHRYINRPMKEWFVSELQEALGSSVHDVQMILNLLSTRDDLDMNNVGMYGIGSGATIAVLAAAADPRIKAIDLVNPWGDWPEWMAKSDLIPEQERPRYLKPEFLKKVEPLDPVAWLPKLKTAHIHLQLVLDDAVTPMPAMDKIKAAAVTAQIVVFKTTPQFSQAGSSGKFLQWTKAQLQPGAVSQPAAQGLLHSPANQPVSELNHSD